MKENKDISKNFVLIEPKSSDEEVLNLLELARMILSGWKIIFSSMIVCTVVSVYYAITLPSIFKAEILLTPSQENVSPTSTLGQFGGLAASGRNISTK